MEILKTTTDWAKAEVFSTSFFILIGFCFLFISLGFWKLGKTSLAESYITPFLVTGTLLMVIGFGLFFTNIARIKSFTASYNNNVAVFVDSEIERVDDTLKEYRIVVFKVIPLLIIIAALLIMFVNNPTSRAIGITTIAMLIVILLIDGTAHARIKNYKAKLVSVNLLR